VDTNKKTVLEALEMAKGIVTDACRATKTPRSTFYMWCNTDLDFKAAVDDIQEVAIDYVEGKLFEKIDGVTMVAKGQANNEDEPAVYTIPPSDTAIIFYLKTKGKKRGYVEKTEQEQYGKDGGPIQTESKFTVEVYDYTGESKSQ
jgi:hypothetical protein